MSFFRSPLLVLLVAVTGCSATPKIMHREIPKAIVQYKECPDTKEIECLDTKTLETLSGVTYQATGNLLLLDEALDSERKLTGKVTVASVPFEANATIYSVEPKSGIFTFTRTSLGASYAPNSRVLRTLGVKVKDDRKQFVTAVGSVLTAVTAAAAVGVASQQDVMIIKPIFPFAINTVNDLKSLVEKDDGRLKYECPIKCRAIQVPEKSKEGSLAAAQVCGNITYGALPADAVRRAYYMETVKDKWTDTFPVAACRSVEVSLNSWRAAKDINVSGRLLSWPAVDIAGVRLNSVVSDPDFVRIVKLPPTGTIDFHTSCGADVLVGDVATDSIWAAVAELGTQAKAAQEARDSDTDDDSGENADAEKTTGDKETPGTKAVVPRSDANDCRLTP